MKNSMKENTVNCGTSVLHTYVVYSYVQVSCHRYVHVPTFSSKKYCQRALFFRFENRHKSLKSIIIKNHRALFLFNHGEFESFVWSESVSVLFMCTVVPYYGMYTKKIQKNAKYSTALNCTHSTVVTQQRGVRVHNVRFRRVCLHVHSYTFIVCACAHSPLITISSYVSCTTVRTVCLCFSWVLLENSSQVNFCLFCVLKPPTTVNVSNSWGRLPTSVSILHSYILFLGTESRTLHTK